MAHAPGPLGQEELRDRLDVVLRARLGDPEVVTDVVAARSQAQRPAVVEDRLAQTPLLEAGVPQVVIELHGAQSPVEDLAVDLRGRMVVAVDIGRIGTVPQLIGRRLRSRGIRLRGRRDFRRRDIRRSHAVGGLLRLYAGGYAPDPCQKQNQSFHNPIIV